MHISASNECPAPVVTASRPVPRCEEDFADMFQDEDVLLSEGMQMHAAKHRLAEAEATDHLRPDDLTDVVWKHYMDVHSGTDGMFVSVKACPGHVINAR